MFNVNDTLYITTPIIIDSELQVISIKNTKFTKLNIIIS